MFKGVIQNIDITPDARLVVLGNRESSVEAICRHIAGHYPEILHAFLRILRPRTVSERWTCGCGVDISTKILVADDAFWWFGPTATAMEEWGLRFDLKLYDSNFELTVS